MKSGLFYDKNIALKINLKNKNQRRNSRDFWRGMGTRVALIDFLRYSIQLDLSLSWCLGQTSSKINLELYLGSPKWQKNLHKTDTSIRWRLFCAPKKKIGIILIRIEHTIGLWSFRVEKSLKYCAIYVTKVLKMV